MAEELEGKNEEAQDDDGRAEREGDAPTQVVSSGPDSEPTQVVSSEPIAAVDLADDAHTRLMIVKAPGAQTGDIQPEGINIGQLLVAGGKVMAAILSLTVPGGSTSFKIVNGQNKFTITVTRDA